MHALVKLLSSRINLFVLHLALKFFLSLLAQYFLLAASLSIQVLSCDILIQILEVAHRHIAHVAGSARVTSATRRLTL